MTDAVISRLKETQARDASVLRRNIQDLQEGITDDSVSWRNRMEITEISSVLLHRPCVRVFTSDKEKGSMICETFTFFSYNGVFIIRIVDENTMENRDCFSCESRIANDPRYVSMLKEFYEKWLDPMEEMAQEAERIAAETRRFGEAYDYWDFQDYQSSIEEGEDVVWMLNDASGKECLAAAKWFYGFEKEQDETDPDAKSMKEWAGTIRNAIVEYADRWFHNTITEAMLEEEIQKDIAKLRRRGETGREEMER